MGKRGRPPKKKSNAKTSSKLDECYTILSSDEETGFKNEKLRLPSPTQRRGSGNERTEINVSTPSDRSKSLTSNTEKTTSTNRKNNDNNKKKIKLSSINKKSDTSADSDATEVYVKFYFICFN